MNRNLANVGVTFVLLAAGIALGVMWSFRVDPWLHPPPAVELAMKARPVVTLLVIAVCGLAAYARTLRHAVLILVALGLTQLVVSIGYAAVRSGYSGFQSFPVG